MIGERLFAVVVGMSVVTTLVVPPLLRSLARRLPDATPAQTPWQPRLRQS